MSEKKKNEIVKDEGGVQDDGDKEITIDGEAAEIDEKMENTIKKMNQADEPETEEEIVAKMKKNCEMADELYKQNQQLKNKLKTVKKNEIDAKEKAAQLEELKKKVEEGKAAEAKIKEIEEK